jgi:hypothetical protein
VPFAAGASLKGSGPLQLESEQQGVGPPRIVAAARVDVRQCSNDHRASDYVE